MAKIEDFKTRFVECPYCKGIGTVILLPREEEIVEENKALQAELDKMRQERDEWKGLARKDFKEHAPEFVLDDIYLRLRTLYGD